MRTKRAFFFFKLWEIEYFLLGERVRYEGKLIKPEREVRDSWRDLKEYKIKSSCGTFSIS